MTDHASERDRDGTSDERRPEPGSDASGRDPDADPGPEAGRDRERAAGGGRDRDYVRAGLAALALLAALLAAATLPALSPSGTASPAGSLVPAPDGSVGGGVGALGASGLGALDPGTSTNVGGDLAESALRSRSSALHFVARSSGPEYWRTGAYDAYTGEGWERTVPPGDRELPLRAADGSGPGSAGESVDYRVRLNRTARALPTVWRPRSVDGAPVEVTEFGAVRPERALPSGASYEATSVRPVRDPSVLRELGRAYPDRIEDRYTALPPDTRRRLGPFVDRLAGNASSPYEAAERIESWLERTKEYSLNVSRPPGDDVASEFVYSMDRGYCEYFATSMTAMLRSQGIPARYVVGYSTGQRLGDGAYAVRGMNAHAWTEVYFPEVGWVRFDPTPARERLAGEERAYERQEGDDYSTSGSGSPGETFSVGDRTTPAGGADAPDGSDAPAPEDGTPVDGAAGGYEVSLNRTAVPGAPVTVTVRRGGRPVEDATVLFDGDAVGRTGATGNLTATVPYTRRLNVTVVEGGAATEGGTPAALAPPSAPVPERVGGDRRLFATTAGFAGTDNTSTTFDVSTDATVGVEGTVATGSEVAVVATVDGVPVRGAAVRLDGRRVGTTDAAGRTTVGLPDRPGSVRVAVERGPVAGNRTLRLARLNVTVEPSLPLALPGTDATVNATLAGRPAAVAPVSVDGERVGETGPDGTATATLPVAGSATVEVRRFGQTASTTVSGLLVNLAGVVLAVTGAAVGLVVAARRRDVTSESALAAVRTAGRALVAGLVGLAAAAERALSRVADRAERTRGHLRALVAGRRSPAALLATLRAWLRERTASLPGTDSGPRAGAAPSADPRRAVRTAWRSLLSATTLRRPATRTPGQIARHAVERDGLPEEPVRTLRDALRAVEYGGRDPDERLSAVERARAALERTLDDGDDGDAAGAAGPDGSDEPGAGGPAPAEAGSVGDQKGADDDRGDAARDGEDGD